MDRSPFPLVAAHTGCDGTPYNTVESFMAGVRLGADIVEVDLRVARDGTVVLLHDDNPLLRECTYEQLNEPDVRASIDPLYERRDIVKLTDVLPLARSCRVKLNLDIKTPEAIEPVVRLVKRHDAADDVYVTGCSDNITRRHRDLRVVYNTPTKLPAERQSEYGPFASQMCDIGREGSCYGLNMHRETCRPEIVELAREYGLAVWVYTVNEAEEMMRFVRCGVDAITTKRVAGLVGLRDGGLSGK
jgi:glycerophosphoryl diester phosphodiesterase